jgi:hypothetical protein
VLVNKLTPGLLGPIRSHVSHSLLMMRIMFGSVDQLDATEMKPSERSQRRSPVPVSPGTMFCPE